MQAPITSIVIKDRVRCEMGDLAPLMESMRKHGQLNPIVVTHDYELIAGHRRLESARRLGWNTVVVVLSDCDSPITKLEIELEENVYRKDLSPPELLEGYSRLEKLKNPGVLARVRKFFKRVFSKLAWWKRKPKRSKAMDAGETENTTEGRPAIDLALGEKPSEDDQPLGV